jgi:putative ABC transport system permease protein
MFIYLNALKNLLRNKGRNILVSVILLIVMTTTTVSMSVSSMSDAMIDRYEDGFGVETNIIPDYDYIMSNQEIVPIFNEDGEEIGGKDISFPAEITYKEHLEYAKSPYVMKTLICGITSYASDSLKYVLEERYKTYSKTDTLEGIMELYGCKNVEDLKLMVDDAHLERMLDTKPNAFGNVFAYTDSSMMKDFRRGEKRLIEGRMVNVFLTLR